MSDANLNKYPPTLRDLVDEIVKIVPETIDSRDIIFALIKTYVHHEKYFIWNDMKNWLNKDTLDWFYESVVRPKIETHGINAWGNYDQNLEWVKKYQSIPNSSKFIQGDK